MSDESSLRCRRGTWCANARRESITLSNGSTSTTRVPDWATTPNGLCRTDTTLSLRAIEQIPRDYLELSLLLGKAGRVMETQTGGTRELPVPIRLGIEALQQDLVDEVALWAEIVADRVGMEWRRGTRAEYILRAGSPLLASHHEILLAVPPTLHLAWGSSYSYDEPVRCPGGHWIPDGGVCRQVHFRRVWREGGRSPVSRDGVDGALRLLELHEKVAAAEGRTHRAHQLWSPCPRCHAVALRRDEGSSSVDCARCGHRMNLDQYDELADVMSQAYAAKATA